MSSEHIPTIPPSPLGYSIDLYYDLQEEILNLERHSALLSLHQEGDEDAKLDVMEFFITAVSKDHLQEKMLELNIFSALDKQLTDKDWRIRLATVKFFTAASAQGRLREKAFDTNTVTELLDRLVDIRKEVRLSVVAFMEAAASQSELREKIFEPQTTSGPSFKLLDNSNTLPTRSASYSPFINAGLHGSGDQSKEQIFDTETVSGLLGLLADENWYVKSRIVEIFIAIVCKKSEMDRFYYNLVRGGSSDFADKDSDQTQVRIFLPETVSALSTGLFDVHWQVRHRLLEFFTAATSRRAIWKTVFAENIVSKLLTFLRQPIDKNEGVRLVTVKFFTAAASQGGLREKIFDSETISALLGLLTDHDPDVRLAVVEFFTIAGSQDGLREKILQNSSIEDEITKLLSDEAPDVRSGVLKFLNVVVLNPSI